jgi:hypothetical protein
LSTLPAPSRASLHAGQIEHARSAF